MTVAATEKRRSRIISGWRQMPKPPGPSKPKFPLRPAVPAEPAGPDTAIGLPDASTP
jgi:hypothetical protein